MSIQKIIREPLLHFLVVGFVLYALLGAGEDYAEREKIVINRAKLVEFVQFRTKTFNKAFAESRLEEMSKAELQDLIRQFRREEALYREARKLGLEYGDYVIRQRLVGKMKYLMEPGLPEEKPDEEALKRFFEDNKNDYARPASITFTHLFFSEQGRTEAELIKLAGGTLEELAARGLSPEAAGEYGERFLFHTNYVDRSYSYVQTELGRMAADRIFSEATPVNTWFGPVRSAYGAHLVFVMNKHPAELAALVDVYDLVVSDFAREKQRVLQEATEAAIMSNYEVEVAPEVMDWLDDRETQSAVVETGRRQGADE